MAFEWISFLDSHGIFYATSGPNVSRGHVAVHCPFCGPADPSQHMSINIAGAGWKCWRRDEHRGKSPVYLVQALLNTTLDRARGIVGDQVFIPEGDFMSQVMSRVNPEHVSTPGRKLVMPDEFKRIEDQPSARRIINYLTGPTRQFTLKQVMNMSRYYGLRYSMRGSYKGRIIFPIKYQGELVSWTGRSIYPNETLRYKTLSTDPEREATPAIGPINDYLLFHDSLLKNVDNFDTIVLCEGPFDALKVRVIGKRYGITATCFFTASPSQRQIDALHDVMPRYKRRYILLDRGTLATAMKVLSQLLVLRPEALLLPDRIKDPGLLTERELLKLIPLDG